MSDAPSAALVVGLAEVFESTGGDMRAVMQQLIASPELWQAGPHLFKTPLDFACSALGAVGGASQRREIALSLGFLATAGQPMHGWQTPDGYAVDAATWLVPEALTRRVDYALNIGRRAAQPDFLLPFLSENTRRTIALEPAALRAGLMLSSPYFMAK